ncbi:MAG TPA: type II toxin-antitoxin system VapC family toxin [Gemmatimonadaceae bacterium]|nr:type II toxin-antitoxin system VapC family toxin [Gemmatimonadaceae bacterium]
MRLLLDTHVLIWWDEGAHLRPAALRAIREADQVYVSAASAWEIAMKISIGRLSTRRVIADAIRESGFEELPVRISHAELLRDMPLHHRDPFDRLLAAQAMAEGLTIVTRDSAFDEYRVRVIQA